MYSLRVAKTDLWGTISLVTTSTMLGIKISKAYPPAKQTHLAYLYSSKCHLQVSQLQVLWEYKKKQTKKCASLDALERAIAAGEGTAVINTTCTKAEPLELLCR